MDDMLFEITLSNFVDYGSRKSFPGTYNRPQLESIQCAHNVLSVFLCINNSKI